jgi:hypothetical protein
MCLRVVWYVFTISREHSPLISCPKLEGRILKWRTVNYLQVYTWSHARPPWSIQISHGCMKIGMKNGGLCQPPVPTWTLPSSAPDHHKISSETFRNRLHSPNEYANWLLASWFLGTRSCPTCTDAGRIPVLQTLTRLHSSNCLLVFHVVITVQLASHHRHPQVRDVRHLLAPWGLIHQETSSKVFSRSLFHAVCKTVLTSG